MKTDQDTFFPKDCGDSSSDCGDMSPLSTGRHVGQGESSDMSEQSVHMSEQSASPQTSDISEHSASPP